jgi:hypothetical protein
VPTSIISNSAIWLQANDSPARGSLRGRAGPLHPGITPRAATASAAWRKADAGPPTQELLPPPGCTSWPRAPRPLRWPSATNSNTPPARGASSPPPAPPSSSSSGPPAAPPSSSSSARAPWSPATASRARQRSMASPAHLGALSAARSPPPPTAIRGGAYARRHRRQHATCRRLWRRLSQGSVAPPRHAASHLFTHALYNALPHSGQLTLANIASAQRGTVVACSFEVRTPPPCGEFTRAPAHHGRPASVPVLPTRAGRAPRLR